MIIKDATKTNILVLMEDAQARDFTTLLLMGEGYKIHIGTSNDDGLAILAKEAIDLVISDYKSSNIDSCKLCKDVKGKPAIAYIPIIILTLKTDYLMKSKVVFAGADDFIEKPFTADELLTRVKANLLRVYRYQDINNLTGLRGFSTAIKQITAKIDKEEVFALGFTDLLHLNKFNARYGFRKGDEIIKATSDIICTALNELGSSSDTLFHIGGDDFIFLTSADCIDDICHRIIKDFDEAIPFFYDAEDRNRSYIVVKNRQGHEEQWPILRIHIGVAVNSAYAFTSYFNALEIANDLQATAKKFEQSTFNKEKRK